MSNNDSDSLSPRFFHQIIFICVSLLIAPLLQAQETMVINTGFSAPMTNKEQTGFGDQVLGEAFRRMGYKLETVILPPERALINANLGIDDGDLLRIDGLEKIYPNLIKVPEKIMDMDVMLFTKNKPNFKVKGWNSVANHIVTIVTGWKVFEKNLGKNVDVIKTDNIGLMFTLLRKDRADFAGYERWAGLDYLKKNNIRDIVFLEPPLTKTALYTYLHKKHKHLIPKLAATIKAMKKDGTIKKLHNKLLAPLMN